MNFPKLKPASFFRAAIVLAFAAASLPATNFCQMGPPVVRFVRNPDPAPDFKLKDFDGKDLSIEESHGKVVLLNFWATWCGPCRAEIPSLIELQKKYPDQLRIIGLLVDEDDDKEGRSVVSSEGINYPVALADDKTRFDYGGISALPTVFVINSDGKVMQKHVGLYDPELYETEVRALLNLPVAAKIETFDDQGDIFLKHADRAKILPGVNMSKLTPEQRAAALKKFNAESCNCGCKFTLAQCRIYDPACQISQKRTAEIVQELASGEVKSTAKTIPASASDKKEGVPAPSANPSQP